MVQVIGHRSDLGRTKNGENMSKSQLGWDFRVVPTNNINKNAYMLILINKLTGMYKIPDFLENSWNISIPECFRKFRIFCSGTNGKSIRMVRAISIPNFRMIGPLVPEKQGTDLLHKIPGQVIGLRGEVGHLNIQISAPFTYQYVCISLWLSYDLYVYDF